MRSDTAKLSVVEKSGYGLGDTAANFIFQTMLVFQTFYYTNVFGISPAEAGTLLLVARVWDAVFDPLMGVIADRTKTRWGKFRPWILWTAVPFGVMAFMIFTTPDFDHTGKLVYAYVTYIVFMTIYSANNLPYSALSGVMTGNMAERTSLSSYRFTFAMLGGLAVKGLAPMMVDYFGKAYDAAGQVVVDAAGDPVINRALGYQWTMGVFSALCIVFFVITFATTKERIQPDPSQTPSLRRDFGDLLKNGPWAAMFLLTTFVFITLAMRGSVMEYYFTYYLDFGKDKKMFSLFLVLSQAANIIGIFFSKPLSMRFGKRNVFVVGLLLTTVLYAAFGILPPRSALGPVFAVELISAFFYGTTIPLLWAMMGDVADFGEWKSGRRATGVIFSAIVFALKAGLGIGGATTGWLLTYYGYVQPVGDQLVQQSDQTLLGIRLTASVFSAIPFTIGIICLLFYSINIKTELEIQDTLSARRSKFEQN
jgi:GPH family glycoside/pentoside/hexuronide:cation symporter